MLRSELEAAIKEGKEPIQLGEKDMYYHKVEIKSEQDLPKEAGAYYIACFGSNKDLTWYSFNKENKENQDFWKAAVDWYLQPVEPQQPAVYDEAYLNECIEKAKPNLSKIADVDKALDEIRGIEDRKIKLKEDLLKFLTYYNKLWDIDKVGKTNTEIIDFYLGY